MIYFIIPLIIIIVLAIMAFLSRKRHLEEISRMEKEKLQIQNKPIFEEMTKVKQLNMTGETEEMFERWRSTWTDVIDERLPKVDLLLLDTESQIDRFNFKKATQTEKQIVEIFAQCEEDMRIILRELHQLIESEEMNRVEIDTIKQHHRAARKRILAHQYSFGPAVESLEKVWESFLPRFEQYDALIESGNYLQAREIVVTLTEKEEQLTFLLQEIPELLTELQTKIPAALRELRKGIIEMEGQSYYLGHLKLPTRFDNIEQRVTELRQPLARLEVEDVAHQVREIHDEIESFYDVLEEEVSSRHYVEEHWEPTLDLFEELQYSIQEMIEEVKSVQESYRLEEDELQIPHTNLQKLGALAKRVEEFIQRQDRHESAYSERQVELQAISEELAEVSEEHKSFSNRIKNLRIDENMVRSRLVTLTQQLHVADRDLRRANIPGVPDEMEIQLEEAEEQIFIVKQSLEEVPLNMALVDSYVKNAVTVVEDVCEKASDMIENALLVERIIQYGNRHRATHPNVHEKLLQAEEMFMQYRYLRALEEAATAVEEVEPGAMKKIQSSLHQQV